MEYCEGFSLLCSVKDKEERKQFEQPVTEALKQLDATVVDGHQVVHGDFRDSNILVNASSLEVRIIDFDWAGRRGIDTYPMFMNHNDIEWPDGASDGALLKQEHDTWWLKKHFG